jgi:hypothetical protein
MPMNGYSTPYGPGQLDICSKIHLGEEIIAAIEGTVEGETHIDPAVATR